jgi:hypothetical protein
MTKGAGLKSAGKPAQDRESSAPSSALVVSDELAQRLNSRVSLACAR